MPFQGNGTQKEMCYTSAMKTYLGTWQAAPSDGFWTDQNLGESEKTISFAMKSGISGYDCAQSYGHGQAEQTLGKVLRRQPGTDFHVDTKIMPTTKDPETLAAQSIQRLGRGIDCLYLHWPRTGFDNRSFLERMAELKDKALIRRLGVCNLPLRDLEALVSDGLAIDRVQRPLSLLWSRDYDQCARFCKEHNIELAVYSPSGMGLLSGRYRSAEDLKDARRKLFCFKGPCLERYRELLDLIGEIADAHGVSNTKVALAWTRSREPDILILGARNRMQLSENLEPGPSLSEAELDDLTEASRSLDSSAVDVPNIFSYHW